MYVDFNDETCVGIFAYEQPGSVMRDLNLVKKNSGKVGAEFHLPHHNL